MLELGFNTTEYGKSILAACFVTDLGTVIALGLIFAPFTARTMVFVVVCAVLFALLPRVTSRFFERNGGRVSELETKFILLALFGTGGLAVWAHSEPVLPAYVIGMLLAGTVGRDHQLVRRLRTLTLRECVYTRRPPPSTAAVVAEAGSGGVGSGRRTAARDGTFDLLIIGYHGHSVIFERVLGSTAQSIVRHAPCSVLLAK